MSHSRTYNLHFTLNSLYYVQKRRMAPASPFGLVISSESFNCSCWDSRVRMHRSGKIQCQSGQVCLARRNCFTTWTKGEDVILKKGCDLSPEGACSHSDVLVTMHSECCMSEWCNNATDITPNRSMIVTQPCSGSFCDQQTLIIIVGSILSALLFTVLVFILVYRKLRKQKMKTDISEEFSDGVEASESPFFIARTMAKDVQLQELIGCGGFGSVYKATYRGNHVAVKIFTSLKEASWEHEMNIYITYLLPHENILGFVGADTRSHGQVRQKWLITAYHKKGSLYDFLSGTTVSLPELLIMMHSALNGLLHLHTQIVGAEKCCKPAIAHRDIKSKNILVKGNGECCIADLGLAVLDKDHNNNNNNNTDSISNNKPVGTVPYMAPEVLDGSIIHHSFEALKKADVYSMALVMYEAARRCHTFPSVADCFEQAYEGMVPPNPDVVAMRMAVNQRPVVPDDWSTCSIMMSYTNLIVESWATAPGARLPTMVIKKKLNALRIIANETSSTY